MTEFHFEDPDLKNSTLEIGFSSCAIEKVNFTDSQGKRIRTENKESFQAEVRKQRHIRVVVAVAVLVAKGPLYLFFGSVDVQVTRVGGAFGGKYQYPPKIAAACAVAAQKLDRYVSKQLLNSSLGTGKS